MIADRSSRNRLGTSMIPRALYEILQALNSREMERGDSQQAPREFAQEKTSEATSPGGWQDSMTKL